MKAVHRIAVVGVVVVTGLAVGACGSASPPEPTVRKDNSGVTVTARLATTHDGAFVKVTFSPDQAGFHIYSVTLPDKGINGLGIPTRLSVRDGLTATGTVSADKPVKQLDMPDLGVALPVYPDGPVTLTLPVKATGTGTDHGDVVVSYGACSPSTCMAPVIGQVMSLNPR